MTRIEFPDITLLGSAIIALTLQALVGGLPIFTPLILALIALIGMPHGGLDLVLAKKLWPIKTAGRLALFLSLYLALAGLVVIAWMLNPTLALIAFLAYSALHFADDWPAGIGGLAGGALVLALPALTDQAQTGVLFSALRASGSAVAEGLAIAAIPAGLVFMISARHAPRLLMRMMFLIGCSVILSPLAYFFVYFCGLHGVQHMQRVNRSLGFGWRASMRGTLAPSLLTFAALGAAGLWLAAGQMAIDETMMRVVFIAFAALTVPHMVLVDLFARATASLRDADTDRSAKTFANEG